MIKKAPLHFEKPFLYVTITLTILGLLTFFSASLSTLTAEHSLYKNMLIQIMGLTIGYALVYGALVHKKINYQLLYKQHYALYLFIGSLLLQLLVFSPLGTSRNGALRWIDIGITTIQPSELLKIALVLFLAALLVGYKKKIKQFKTLVLISLSTVGVVGLLMLLIRDKGTLIIIGCAVLAMFFAARVRMIHILIFFTAGLFVMAGLVGLSPGESYAKNRIVSFLGLESNPLGNDFQINQSIITVGSGEIFGKGLGQSIQKHGYLPEPLTDSIFAVYAEEWGFVGSVFLVCLYLVFLYFALLVAKHARDDYGRYITVGLSILVVAQSLFNIMALVKLVPLSGMPLVFVSKGGSSLVMSLLIVAIILNVSRVSHTGGKKKKK